MSEKRHFKTHVLVIGFLCVGSFVLPLSSVGEDAAPKTPLQNKRIFQISEEFDWSEITPLDFLDMLKNEKGSLVSIRYTNRPPKDWIKKEHVGKLMRLIGSEEMVASVASVPDSTVYPASSYSTVGNEAMYLIEGFRSKEYPPTICSTYDFKADPREYRKWWMSLTMHTGFRGIGGGQKTGYTEFREKILKDTKPADLSIADAVLLKKEVIRMGHGKTTVLVNRLTNKVEYVWAYGYGCFVKPKYMLPNVQALYDRWRR